MTLSILFIAVSFLDSTVIDIQLAIKKYLWIDKWFNGAIGEGAGFSRTAKVYWVFSCVPPTLTYIILFNPNNKALR